MKKITADEFLAMIEANPSIFENWNTPLEITEYVECRKSPITHLSKHLIFTKNIDGTAAYFNLCPNLKIATGTFHGYVSFGNAGIEKIEAFTVTQPNKIGEAATFAYCLNLKIATGNYPGFVNFGESGVHSIKNLHIQKPDKNGDYVAFYNCHNLHTLEGWDLNKQIWIEKHKLQKEIKRRTSLQKFVIETSPKELPFL
jgi:hypothetical protein